MFRKKTMTWCARLWLEMGLGGGKNGRKQCFHLFENFYPRSAIKEADLSNKIFSRKNVVNVS
jgi:hypothetical protein